MGNAATHEPLDLAAEWRDMQRRLVVHLETGSKTDLADDVMQIEAKVYTDPLRFAAEREKIFREVPLLVGFSGELSSAGDRILFDAAGTPVIVLRGSDGRLRAFLNLCTHRGAQLATSCERSKRLVCPFHGWSFDIDGELKSLPLAAAFEGLDKRELGLVPVPVAEWQGMVFVKARAGEEEIDVAEFLGSAAPLFAALDLGSLRLVKTERVDVRSNWKFALDTFCEIYHVPVVHKDSLSLNLYPNVAIFDAYGRHQRYSGAPRDFEGLLGKPESQWPQVNYQAVHFLFPNTTFAFTHSLDGKTPVVAMFRLFPGESPGEAITLASTYGRGDAEGISDAQVAQMHAAVLEIVGVEDYGLARDSWPSLENAPPDFKFLFGRSEVLLQHYHRDLADAIGMPLT
ncbi:MAG: aromatic ring-hydroxylating dioxygenase subunit alpha [Deltaproteobacteria bacterium]|nr:aromatic ring-hydroxylating dioxygenase subunit alpha [Deltaproteobacteria bacterium]MBW2361523.1 aromatic ring-hydroxylating dioxygenase subunit alpha [Deltaproteobacteria bacterium]